MASVAKNAVKSGWLFSLRKAAYNFSGFNKYGLHRDDVIRETPDVLETLRRLPKEVVDDRNFRLHRALLVSAQKTYLPKEQWTQYEDDTPYLEPTLSEVQAELAEQAEWQRRG